MPAAQKRNPRLKISHRIPQDLLKGLDAAATKEGRSRANLIERLLREGLKRRSVAVPAPVASEKTVRGGFLA